MELKSFEQFIKESEEREDFITTIDSYFKHYKIFPTSDNESLICVEDYDYTRDRVYITGYQVIITEVDKQYWEVYFDVKKVRLVITKENFKDYIINVTNMDNIEDSALYYYYQYVEELAKKITKEDNAKVVNGTVSVIVDTEGEVFNKGNCLITYQLRDELKDFSISFERLTDEDAKKYNIGDEKITQKDFSILKDLIEQMKKILVKNRY